MQGLKEIPENELEAQEYNDLWNKVSKYAKEHPYVNEMVELMITHCPQPLNVLEVGSGFGFAAKKILKTLDPQSYTMYEFSNAIDYAMDLIGPVDVDCHMDYVKDTFRNIDDMHVYDCVVAMEIFEHIVWDLEFIEKIKSGSDVFFSVPLKPSRFHVRWFNTIKEVRDRYGELLDIKQERFVPNKWWCIASKRR